MISAGRVLIKPRGEWDSLTTYYMLDLVNYNGYAWLAKRTVVGIEPSNDRPDEWHNLLSIDEVVSKAISSKLADDVSKLLKESFSELLSEARRVDDLFAEYTEPTFVKWDSNTANTPKTAGLTSCYEGFALVFGKIDTSHNVTAWTKDGEAFSHTVSDGKDEGWSTTIMSSGGTMTAPLVLGSGKGAVSADDDGTYLEAKKDSDNSRFLNVSNAKLEDAVKLDDLSGEETKGYRLFGEHNLESMRSAGVAMIATDSYLGSGKGGENYPSSLTFPFVPKLVIISAPTDKGGKIIAINGQESTDLILDTSSATPPSVYFNWVGKKLSWYSNNGSSYADKAESQLTKSGVIYHWIAIG